MKKLKETKIMLNEDMPILITFGIISIIVATIGWFIAVAFILEASDNAGYFANKSMMPWFMFTCILPWGVLVFSYMYRNYFTNEAVTRWKDDKTCMIEEGVKNVVKIKEKKKNEEKIARQNKIKEKNRQQFNNNDMMICPHCQNSRCVVTRKALDDITKTEAKCSMCKNTWFF